MSFFSTVFRRIFVRTADKAISTHGRNILIGLGDYNPSLPTIKRLIINVAIFSIANFVLIKLFLLFGLIVLAFITPLFFLKTILTPLISKHIYNRKQQAIAVNDRRYSSGYRTVGYKFIKDKSEKIDFTTNQIKVSRLEGLVKLCLALFFIFFVYSKINSKEYKASKLTENEVKELLRPNDILISKNSEALVYIKVKSQTSGSYDKVKKYDTTFITFEQGYKTFKLKDKELGMFLFIDSSSKYGEKFIALKPFERIDSITKLNSNQNRVDSTFYILLNDITIKLKS
jgi:hypothetical protein